VALPGRDCDTGHGWSISKGEEERAFSSPKAPHSAVQARSY